MTEPSPAPIPELLAMMLMQESRNWAKTSKTIKKAPAKKTVRRR